MLDFTCQVCGELPDTKSVQCPNCGSKVSFEHNNPFTTRPLFSKNFWKIGGAVIAGFMALNIWFVSSSAAAIGSLVTGALPNISDLSGGALDENYLLEGTDESPIQVDPGTDGTDDGGSGESASPSSNSYELTQKQIDAGYEEWESSGVAWRWTTDSEEASLSCSYAMCSHVKIIALRNCKSILLNGSLSTDSTYDDQTETLVGYGNDNIDNSGLKAGKGSTVELGTDSNYDVDTWTYLTYISCSDQAIGHD
ncbi:MAG: hypothetical protein RL140_526 [Actinomycetota bacterium]|jgi:hypothetical protein